MLHLNSLCLKILRIYPSQSPLSSACSIEVCDVRELEGKPKLFFIDACRGRESNVSNVVMTKSGSVPQQMGISPPKKQDVFVGFATVPGYVSFTSSAGSPYLQTLSTLLESHYKEMDLSDIHLMVKRTLARSKLGESHRQTDRQTVIC